MLHQTNRFTSAVRKLLSIKGEAPEPSFGMHIEDERPEHSFIKGETRWAQFQDATSAAGTLPIIGVRNPDNSGVLVVVDRVFFFTDPALGPVVNLETLVGPTGIPGGLVSMFGTDTRKGLQQTTARTGGGAAAAYAGHIVTQIIPTVAFALIDAVSPETRVHPIVLAPGSELVLCGSVVGAIELAGTFCGYERAIESGELIPGG